ncbi:hypothetical protein AC578_3828 [Pseudocercospora eumusae]|uniref:Uncharacterized protein n=1 Tax=Pseudocercospora eumusae TaxID=321146 RepID=A0A139HFP2_9PEZI|nr:hypothetical protein AC578_3828 [Pseudocercospora eumusae]
MKTSMPAFDSKPTRANTASLPDFPCVPRPRTQQSGSQEAMIDLSAPRISSASSPSRRSPLLSASSFLRSRLALTRSAYARPSSRFHVMLETSNLAHSTSLARAKDGAAAQDQDTDNISLNAVAVYRRRTIPYHDNIH